MKIDRTGCTRIVILIGDWAIKIPDPTVEWKLFLNGLLGNMQERVFFTTKDKRLCPIIFSIPGGWMNIMKRARVMTDSEFLYFDSKSWSENNGDLIVPCEHKSNSFGWLDDKIVCIDYGS